jgi:hypothetical protein
MTRPEGKVAFRLMRNLRPGQIVWPVELQGEVGDDGQPNEWAHITGHPMTLHLSDMFTGAQRQVCRVTARYDHEEEPFVVQDDPGRQVRVILPPVRRKQQGEPT